VHSLTQILFWLLILFLKNLWSNQDLSTTKKKSFYDTFTTSILPNHRSIIHGGTFVIRKCENEDSYIKKPSSNDVYDDFHDVFGKTVVVCVLFSHVKNH